MEWFKNYNEFKASAKHISQLSAKAKKVLCDAVLNEEGYIFFPNRFESQKEIDSIITELQLYAAVKLQDQCCDSVSIIVDCAMESVFIPFFERKTNDWNMYQHEGFKALVEMYFEQAPQSLPSNYVLPIRSRMEELGLREKFDQWFVQTDNSPEMGVSNSIQ